jgi:hypothetical protein
LTSNVLPLAPACLDGLGHLLLAGSFNFHPIEPAGDSTFGSAPNAEVPTTRHTPKRESRGFIGVR